MRVSALLFLIVIRIITVSRLCCACRRSSKNRTYAFWWDKQLWHARHVYVWQVSHQVCSSLVYASDTCLSKWSMYAVVHPFFWGNYHPFFCRGWSALGSVHIQAIWCTSHFHPWFRNHIQDITLCQSQSDLPVWIHMEPSGRRSPLEVDSFLTMKNGTAVESNLQPVLRCIFWPGTMIGWAVVRNLSWIAWCRIFGFFTNLQKIYLCVLSAFMLIQEFS